MPSHVNLKNKDLSKFSPRAIRCLKWWLEHSPYNCPFENAPGNIRYLNENVYTCRAFCKNVFIRIGCPCGEYSEKYVIATVRAIIKLKEAEHGHQRPDTR